MTNRLLKSTGVVGFLTFLSRILGFLRDMIAAAFFGAGLGYDAFLIAFKIPNFTRRLFAEGAFAQAFVPVLSEYKATQGEAAVERLINRVAGVLGTTLLLLTLFGIIFAPLFIHIFAPGFVDDVRFGMATDMLRITFSYAMLISLTAFAGGILNTYHYFAVPALTPILLNCSIIGCALVVSHRLEEPVYGLAWGVLLGGVTQLLFQLPSLYRLGRIPKPQLIWQDPGVQKIIKLMIPALFGASVAQINLMVDSIFASFLQAGSVSWLYYADRLLEFPLGVFGVALATVILPNLSTKHATQSEEAFSLTLDWALRWIVIIGIPATIGLLCLAGPILTTLFHHGAFTAVDVVRTQHALLALTIGLMAFLSIKILVSAFYAQQDTRYPVRVAMVALATNIVMNIILIRPLAHVGLALASAIAAIVNAYLLFIALRRRGIYTPRTGWGAFALRVTGANILMGVFLVRVSPQLSTWLTTPTTTRVLWLTSIIIGAVLLYTAVLLLFGLRRPHLRQLA